MSKISKLEETFNILETYSGEDPYIKSIQYNFLNNKKFKQLTPFQIEYIQNNHQNKLKIVNKIVKLTDWYAQNRQEEWNLEFTPTKIKIISYLGETATHFNCIIQYRQSVEPQMCFLSKNGILNNFLVEDYDQLNVDFNRYDKLSMNKDKNRKLKLHQKDAVKFLVSRKKCILADDMGLGKTTSLAVASIEGNFDNVLIICPASLKTNWKSELEWYVDSKYISIVDSINNKNKGELEVFLGYKENSSNKTREELLNEAKEVGKWQDNRFVIVNYDIVDEVYEIPKTRSKENIKKAYDNSPMLQYVANKKSLIIIDESHLLSNRTSIRYKVIKDLIKRGNPDSIYLSTGTPVTNNPQNLFNLLSLIENNVTSDWDYYMKRYCGARKFIHPKDKEKRNNISERFIAKQGKKDWYALSQSEKQQLNNIIQKSCRMMTVADGATNLEELKDRISHIYLRRLKEDLGNLPSKTVHEVKYDLNQSQLIEYNKLWDEYVAEKEQEDEQKELNKELLEGTIYRTYLSNQMIPHTEKLCDKLVELGNKVVIACCFDEELYTLKEYYGDKCVIYNGKMNLKQKDEAIKEFTNNDNVKVFIGNMAAASVGITLIVSNKLIFNNMEYVPASCRQMEDRIYRIGQQKDVDVYYQIFRDTQYEKIWNTVLKKELIIDSLIKKEDDK